MLTERQQQQLASNVAKVQQQIGDACHRRGRTASDVRLVAVTKYVSVDVLAALVGLGVTHIGESRVQQLTARAAELADRQVPQPDWHMVGHLQRNKAKQLLEVPVTLHSLDSERLADTLQRQVEATQTPLDVFLEVNISGEDSKHGRPLGAVAPLAEHVAGLSGLRLRGLMTMAPYDPDPETARPHFARLRELLTSLRQQEIVPLTCDCLSMGMSQDFVVAVEEGATHVRIGSGLFEGLDTDDPREPGS